MSTPLVWIAFPAGLAVASFFFRRWSRVVTVSMTVFVFLLALGAWIMPIGELIVLGPWSFSLSDRFVIAGRQFVLGLSDRTMLGIVYLVLAFFFMGSNSAGVSNLFIPLGLAMGTILVASLAVEPFLYAALFIQVTVLIGVPLLSPPGFSVDRSVLRFLAFLSFGLPFLLFSGWMLSRVDIDSAVPTEILPALVFLGLGFAFLLAVFPLNTWIPMLTSRVHPYTATFILTLLPIIIISLLQRFLVSYPWLLGFDVIQFLGLLVVFTGGLWAAFQRNLGRLLGYAIIIEIGRSLLAITYPENMSVYDSMLLPRIFAFGVWALSLALIREQVDDLSFRAVQALGRRSPLIALGVITANFSVAGFPLLAGFPIQLMLLGQLAHISLASALWCLSGSIGLLIGGLRTLAVMVMGPEELPSAITINRLAQLLIVLGLLMLLLAGLFPHWFVDLFPN